MTERDAVQGVVINHVLELTIGLNGSTNIIVLDFSFGRACMNV